MALRSNARRSTNFEAKNDFFTARVKDVCINERSPSI